MWSDLGYGSIGSEVKPSNGAENWFAARRRRDEERINARQASPRPASPLGPNPGASLSWMCAAGPLAAEQQQHPKHLKQKPRLSERIRAAVEGSPAVLAVQQREAELRQLQHRSSPALGPERDGSRAQGGGGGGAVSPPGSQRRCGASDDDDGASIDSNEDSMKTAAGASSLWISSPPLSHHRNVAEVARATTSSSVAAMPHVFQQASPRIPNAAPAQQRQLWQDSTTTSRTALDATTTSITGGRLPHLSNTLSPSVHVYRRTELGTLIDKHDVEPGLPSHAEVERAYGDIMEAASTRVQGSAGGRIPGTGFRVPPPPPGRTNSNPRLEGGRGGSSGAAADARATGAATAALARHGSAGSMSARPIMNSVVRGSQNPSRWRARQRGSSVVRAQQTIPGLARALVEAAAVAMAARRATGSAQSPGRESVPPPPPPTSSSSSAAAAAAGLGSGTVVKDDDDDDDDMGDFEMERRAVAGVPALCAVGPSIAAVEDAFRQRVLQGGASARCPHVTEELFRFASSVVRDLRRQRVQIAEFRLQRLRAKLEGLRAFSARDTKQLELQIEDFELYCEQLVVDMTRPASEKGEAARQLTALHSLRAQLAAEQAEDVVSFENRIRLVEERLAHDRLRAANQVHRAEAPVLRVTAKAIARNSAVMRQVPTRTFLRPNFGPQVRAAAAAPVVRRNMLRLSEVTGSSADPAVAAALQGTAFPPLMAYLMFTECEVAQHEAKLGEFENLQRKRQFAWAANPQDFLNQTSEVHATQTDYSFVFQNAVVPFALFKRMYAQVANVVS